MVDGPRRRGVREVYACCTHAILSPPAVPRILRSPIRQLVVTDSIPVPPEKRTAKTIVLSVAGLLAEAIRRIHADQSVSELFTQSRVAQPAAERE